MQAVLTYVSRSLVAKRKRRKDSNVHAPKDSNWKKI
jgi:hypothetical protein